MEKITGIESLLSENKKFDLWCKDLSAQILKETFISEDELKENIKSKILLNESYFYECICNEIESNIKSVKKKAQLYFKNRKKKDYIETGFVLSELNERLKKYNIERTKSYQRNSYFKLKSYLKDNGLEEVYLNFLEFNRNNTNG